MTDNGSEGMNIIDTLRKTSDRGGIYESGETELTYTELLQVDFERKKINSQCEESSLKILTRIKGTILLEIIRDFFFWFTIVCYTVFRILLNYEIVPTPKIISGFNTAMFYLIFVAGFLISFLLWYLGSTNKRYFQFLDEIWFCMGRVIDVATLAKSTLPFERARRITRWVNVAHLAAYTGYKNAYHKTNFFDPLVERFALMNEKEYKRITEDMHVEKNGGKACMEVMTWIMCDIRSALNANLLDPMEANQMRDLVLRLRAILGRILAKQSAPVPFMFPHLINLLTACFLPCFALALALEGGSVALATERNVWHFEVLRVLLLLLIAIFIIGLRIVGQQETEPFGSELVDIQLLSYMNLVLNGTFNILEAAEFEPPDLVAESSLKDELEFKRNNGNKKKEQHNPPPQLSKEKLRDDEITAADSSRNFLNESNTDATGPRRSISIDMAGKVDDVESNKTYNFIQEQQDKKKSVSDIVAKKNDESSV